MALVVFFYALSFCFDISLILSITKLFVFIFVMLIAVIPKVYNTKFYLYPLFVSLYFMRS